MIKKTTCLRRIRTSIHGILLTTLTMLSPLPLVADGDPTVCIPERDTFLGHVDVNGDWQYGLCSDQDPAILAGWCAFNAIHNFHRCMWPTQIDADVLRGILYECKTWCIHSFDPSTSVDLLYEEIEYCRSGCSERLRFLVKPRNFTEGSFGAF